MRLLQQQQGRGIADPRWVTYRQAKLLDGQVRRGEKASYVIFWMPKEKDSKKKDKKLAVSTKTHKVAEVKAKSESAFIFKRTAVFNGSQVEGLGEAPERLCSWEPAEALDKIVTGLGVTVLESSVSRAAYTPGRDVIEMPVKGKFQSRESYAATLLHEIVHWTGAQGRLNRFENARLPKEDYAREELVADLGAFFLGKLLGISGEIDGHASYIDGWLQLLSKDKSEVSKAARKAQDVVDYVLEHVPALKDDIEATLREAVIED